MMQTVPGSSLSPFVSPSFVGLPESRGQPGPVLAKRNRRRIVFIVIGTRPEAVKLAPVIKELQQHSSLECRVCVSGQHREMLDPFLGLFNIRPDYNLNIMRYSQDLFDVTARVLAGLKEVLTSVAPDIVLVQGDTTTAFAAALASFYLKIKVGHVEAGLRTQDKYNPFPEELNRRLISHLADLHFAPTDQARLNLIREGVRQEKVFVTGNTVVDALSMILSQTKDDPYFSYPFVNPDRRLILVTAHRRESFGQGLLNICQALRDIVTQSADVEVVYPVHLNPNVRSTVERLLQGVERVHLIEPLDYVAFVNLMSRAYLILTDSGGVQEEAPSLGKPVLVMRETTERPEAIEAGVAKLVGLNPARIVQETLRLLNDTQAYATMVRRVNPFGDGRAAPRIVAVLERHTDR